MTQNQQEKYQLTNITRPCRYIAILIVGMMLSACGKSGGEEQIAVSQPQTDDGIKVQKEVTVTPDMLREFPLGQLVKGKPLRGNASVSSRFLAPTGSLTFPLGTSFNENLTMDVIAADPIESLSGVFVRVNQFPASVPLCQGDCGNDFRAVISNFNPGWTGAQPGQITLSLFGQTPSGDQIELAKGDVIWQPASFGNITQDRTETSMSLTWSPIPGALRYNVYVSDTEFPERRFLGSHANIFKTLALPATTASFDLPTPDAVLFAFVTAVSPSGESSISPPLKLGLVAEEPHVDPVANDDTFTMIEDSTTPLSGNLLSNDTDADGDLIQLQTVPIQPPQKGTVTLQQDGTFNYTVNPNESGVDTFVYAITDDFSQALIQGNVTINITDINDPPDAQNDNYTLNVFQDTFTVPAENGLLANDKDFEGQPITLNPNLIEPPGKGQVTINEDGSFSYEVTPTTDFGESDKFIYEISDPEGLTAQATVTIFPPSTDGNSPPIAVNDSYTVEEDGKLEVSIFDSVLSNDSDPNGDPLEASLLDPENSTTDGELAFADDSSFTYTPDPNFNGTDQFTYIVTDGKQIAQAVVNITVVPVNDAPVAAADSYEIIPNSALNIAATNGVLINDGDEDEDPLTAVLISPPGQGTLTLNTDGSFTYTPIENQADSTNFTYAASDGTAQSIPVTVTLTLNNVPPVAVNDNFTTPENVPLTNGNILANDSDPNGDTITVNTTPITGPANGTISLNANGTFTYTPNQNFFGTDTFTYQITDAVGQADTATATITVTDVNFAPVANPDTFTIQEDTTLNGSSIIQNDVDSDGDTLSLITTPSSLPSNGTVTLTSNGIFTYIPNQNFNGTDSFGYQVTDGVETASGTVTVTVTPVNDNPDAVNDTFTINEDTSLTGQNLLTNDIDVDGNTINVLVTPTSSPSNGALTINADGTFTYIPNANFAGVDSFSYGITDNNGGTDTATVTMNITAVNDPPVVADRTISIAENTGAGVQIDTVGVTDVDNTSFTYSITAGNNDGIFSVNSSGGFLVSNTTNLDYETTTQYVITVSVSDGTTSSSGTFTINITNIEEPGSFVSDAAKRTIVELHADNQQDITNKVFQLSSGKYLMMADTLDLVSVVAKGALVRFNADGTLDRTFGFDGIQLFNGITPSFQLRDMIVENDGSTWLIGTSYTATNQLIILRTTASGALDTSFDSDGYWESSFGSHTSAHRALKDSSGNLIIFGLQEVSTQDDFALFKYDISGSSPSLSNSITVDFFGLSDVASELLIDSSQNFILVGQASNSGGNEIGVAKVNVSFNLDTGYGASGKFTHKVSTSTNSDFPLAGILDSSDRLFVGGGATFAGGFDGFLHAVTNAGVTDTSFASSGTLQIDADGVNGSSNNSDVLDLAFDGTSLLVTGAYFDTASNVQTYMRKYNVSSGTLDTSFGTSGQFNMTHTDTGSHPHHVIVQSDNKYVIVGDTLRVAEASREELFIARLSNTGVQDTSLSTDGINTTNIGFGDDVIEDLIELKNGTHAGKFIVVGNVNKSSDSQIIVARYLANGGIDETFGQNGRVTFLYASYGTVHGVTEMSDGKLLLFGKTATNRATIIKLLDTGTFDGTFASSGVFTESTIVSMTSEFRAVKELSGGKLLLSGFGKSSTYNNPMIVRLNSSGTFDTSFNTTGYYFQSLSGLDEQQIYHAATTSSEDKYVFVGQANNELPIVMMLTSSGALDTSFNSTGFDTSTPTGLTVDRFTQVGLDSNNIIYAAGDGTEDTGSTNRMMVVSYNLNGTKNNSFSSDGANSYDVSASNTNPLTVKKMIVEANGGLIIAGNTHNASSAQVIYFTHIHTTGTNNGDLDTQLNNTGIQRVDLVTRESWPTQAISLGGFTFSETPPNKQIVFGVSADTSNAAGRTDKDFALFWTDFKEQQISND
ncbi:Ig-like domain-containing protein [Algicola sagamiensis]|uniref:Ig-like domain-containing protein n=1 Tax=Algicola sagamiensis TaxID=163869 RepID=UPI00037EB1F1|nr:Ig-like domain-containing protein [Algicola sagamiensis]